MKSFSSVAVEVVNEHSPYEENVESIVKHLLRQFTKFVEMTGGSIDELKNEQSRMLFDEDDVPLLKKILSQFLQRSGFAYDFLKKKVDLASIEDTHDLIQQMLDLMVEDGLSDGEAQAIVNWLNRVFQFSFRVEIENCHRLVDGVAANLLLYPYTHSMIYMDQFHHLLKKAFADTVVYTMMGIGELAEILQLAKAVGGTDDPSDLYGEDDDIVKSEYRQRDANVVRFLIDNPEIRHYVERCAGATVEEIWGLTRRDTDDQKADS